MALINWNKEVEFDWGNDIDEYAREVTFRLLQGTSIFETPWIGTILKRPNADGTRIEVRNSLGVSDVLIRLLDTEKHSQWYRQDNVYSGIPPRVPKGSENSFFLQISSNAKMSMTNKQFAEMNLVIQEASAVMRWLITK